MISFPPSNPGQEGGSSLVRALDAATCQQANIKILQEAFGQRIFKCIIHQNQLTARLAVAQSIKSAGGFDSILTLQPGDNEISGRAPARQRVQLVAKGQTIAVTRSDRRGRFKFQLSASQLKQIGEGTGHDWQQPNRLDEV
jgi:hypothetical protein